MTNAERSNDPNHPDNLLADIQTGLGHRSDDSIDESQEVTDLFLGDGLVDPNDETRIESAIGDEEDIDTNRDSIGETGMSPVLDLGIDPLAPIYDEVNDSNADGRDYFGAVKSVAGSVARVAGRGVAYFGRKANLGISKGWRYGHSHPRNALVGLGLTAAASLSAWTALAWNPAHVVYDGKMQNCPIVYREGVDTNDHNEMKIVDRDMTYIYADLNGKPLNFSNISPKKPKLDEIEHITVIDGKGKHYDFNRGEASELFEAHNRVYRAVRKAIVSGERSYLQDRSKSLADRFDPQPARDSSSAE